MNQGKAQEDPLLVSSGSFAICCMSSLSDLARLLSQQTTLGTNRRRLHVENNHLGSRPLEALDNAMRVARRRPELNSSQPGLGENIFPHLSRPLLTADTQHQKINGRRMSRRRVWRDLLRDQQTAILRHGACDTSQDLHHQVITVIMKTITDVVHECACFMSVIVLKKIEILPANL